jgi:hypothetical protein
VVVSTYFHQFSRECYRSTGPGASKSATCSRFESATRSETARIEGATRSTSRSQGDSSECSPRSSFPEGQEIGIEGGGFPKSACRKTNYRGIGLTPNGNAKDGEQSWKLAIRGRLRANGYVCCSLQPFPNLSRNLFPPRRFSPPGDSAGSMAQRDNRLPTLSP